MKKTFLMVCTLVFCLLSTVSAQEVKQWQSNISTGAIYSDGNTHEFSYSCAAYTEKKQDTNRLKLGIEYAYGEEEEKKDNENIKVYEEFEQDIIGTNIYWFGDSSIEKDFATNLERRITLTPGVGIYLNSAQKEKLSIDIGPTYVIEKFEDKGLDDNFIFRIRQRGGIKLNEYVTIKESVMYYSTLDDIDDYRIEVMLSAKIKMIQNLSLNVKIQDKYNNNPQPGIKHNDFSTQYRMSYDW